MVEPPNLEKLSSHAVTKGEPLVSSTDAVAEDREKFGMQDDDMQFSDGDEKNDMM